MSVLQWVQKHDPRYVALRRAGRTAIVMPGLFALGDKVIGNPIIATFAAFGSFALLLLVDFSGSIRDRVRSQVLLCSVGAVFICVGTLANRWAALAAIAMALVAFGVLFSGVVSSVLASATPPLLLSFILPVTFVGGPSTIPDRLAGWGLASFASVIGIALLWPAPAKDPLRASAIVACRALAARLRADVSFVLHGAMNPTVAEHEVIIGEANAAVAALQKTFVATPYRPTGLSTAARSVVRLVDELRWLNAIIGQIPPRPTGLAVSAIACPVRRAAADVLESCADLLSSSGNGSDGLEAALGEMHRTLLEMEDKATAELPIEQFAHICEDQANADNFISALDPSFRAQELTFATAQIGTNVLLSAAADRRTLKDQVLGRQPEGLSNTFAAAQERAVSHFERHSVWLHNSLRGAAALGVAVLVANLAGVAHSFWVVLGALSVLRSNALNIGQNAVKSVVGTAAGFVVGGLLVWLIGTDTTLLWCLFPLAVLIAGFSPAAISFAFGQAAFTVALVILYNIIQPIGWHIGLLRVEDVGLGCLISLGVGVLAWPRGAAVALGIAMSEAYEASVRYLESAVDFAMSRCDRGIPQRDEPREEATRAASASRRLDDTFRSYLAERGAKSLPLAEVTSLVTGPSALRLAADAVLDLWLRDPADAGDRESARREIVASAALVTKWYDDFAKSLEALQDVPAPLHHDQAADRRLLDAVGTDLRREDGGATGTAVRMIWTSDHLDAARRLQQLLVGPASVAVQHRALVAPKFQPVTRHRLATSSTE